MDILKKHGEKLLLLVLLGGLALSVVMVMGGLSGFEKVREFNLSEVQSDLGKDTAGIDALLARLTTDPYRVDGDNDTYTPEVRVFCINEQDKTLIPVDQEVCLYCGVTQTTTGHDTDGDGIPDEIESENGMDPNDPADAYRDQDNDGFFNLYEYQNGTDMADAGEHPPLIDYLRLTDTEEASVQFELRGTARFGEAYTLQLAWKYPNTEQWQTDYVKVGTRFGRRGEFLAKSFTEEIVPRDGRYIDESVAVIQTGRHSLELGRTGDARQGKISEIDATLSLIAGPEWKQSVEYGSTFTLDKNSYKVVDIRTDSVVLKPDPSGDRFTIRPPTDQEIETFKSPEPVQEDTVDDEFFNENMGLNPEDLPF